MLAYLDPVISNLLSNWLLNNDFQVSEIDDKRKPQPLTFPASGRSAYLYYSYEAPVSSTGIKKI